MADHSQLTSIFDGIKHFVYEGTPAFGALVASSARSPGVDMFGNEYPAGEWARDDYRLIWPYELRPGCLLVKRDT